MSKEKKYIPTQSMIGRQVFDTKGSFMGKIKDVAINLEELDVALLIDFKTGETLEVPWSEIQSVEDVILLKKLIRVYESKVTRMKAAAPTPVEVPSPPTPSAPQPPPPPPTPAAPPTVTCPNCGARAPAHAKFCPKCGKPLK